MSTYCTEDDFVLEEQQDSFGFASTIAGPLPITMGGTGTNHDLYRRVNLSLNTGGYVSQYSDTNDLRVTGTLPVANGGTGATSEAEARTSLGLGDAAVLDVDSAPTMDSTDTVTSGGVFLAISPAQFQFLNTFFVSSSQTVANNYLPVVDGFTNTLSFPVQTSVRGRTGNTILAAGSSIEFKTNITNMAIWISSGGELSISANGQVPADALAIIAFVQYRRGSWYVYTASPVICRGPVNGNLIHREDWGIRDIAHKGNNSHIAPENTIEAFRVAKEFGFEWFECDLRKTQDNYWVLCHDTSINNTARMTNGAAISGTVNIASSTLADLRTYTFCGKDALFDEDHQYLIPTLQDTLEFARAADMHIRLELKTTLTLGQATNIAEIVESYGMTDRVEYHSNEYDSLWYMAQVLHNGMLSLLAGSNVTTISDDMIAQLTQLSIHGHKVGISVPVDVPESELAKVTKYGWYVSARTVDNAGLIAAAAPAISAFTTNLETTKPSAIVRDSKLFPLKAAAGIASGAFFMVGSLLYKATAAISAGSDIVPGTNCTEYSIAAALNSLA